MKIPLINFVERLRSSQWVLPGILAVGAVIIAAAALKLDAWASAHLPELPWFVFSGSSDDARQLLATLAGSMVSLTTITFSVTMIVLTLASNQFGPRVLRNFLRDHFNQTILGTFVASLLFCLLLLGQLPASGDSSPPRIAISLAILFTVICLFALLGFVHHTAKSIQTSHVVQRAADQLDDCVQKLFPHAVSDHRSPQDDGAEPDFEETLDSGKANASGYLQAIDLDSMLAWAHRHKTVLKIGPQPGDFITSGDQLVHVSPAHEDQDEFELQVQKWFLLGSERTGEQDARYGFRQLVEIAVRALSPGINDPFTALNAIDQIGCALATVAQREPAPHHLWDDQGDLRIIAPAESFIAIARDAFSPLRFYGREHPLVLAHLIKLLETLSTRVVRKTDQEWVSVTKQELTNIIRELPDEADRTRLQDLAKFDH